MERGAFLFLKESDAGSEKRPPWPENIPAVTGVSAALGGAAPFPERVLLTGKDVQTRPAADGKSGKLCGIAQKGKDILKMPSEIFFSDCQ